MADAQVLLDEGDRRYEMRHRFGHAQQNALGRNRALSHSFAAPPTMPAPEVPTVASIPQAPSDPAPEAPRQRSHTAVVAPSGQKVLVVKILHEHDDRKRERANCTAARPSSLTAGIAPVVNPTRTRSVSYSPHLLNNSTFNDQMEDLRTLIREKHSVHSDVMVMVDTEEQTTSTSVRGRSQTIDHTRVTHTDALSQLISQRDQLQKQVQFIQEEKEFLAKKLSIERNIRQDKESKITELERTVEEQRLEIERLKAALQTH